MINYVWSNFDNFPCFTVSHHSNYITMLMLDVRGGVRNTSLSLAPKMAPQGFPKKDLQHSSLVIFDDHLKTIETQNSARINH